VKPLLIIKFIHALYNVYIIKIIKFINNNLIYLYLFHFHSFYFQGRFFIKFKTSSFSFDFISRI
jgi:hypothetical protein